MSFMNAEDVYRNKEYLVTTTAEERKANGKAFWDQIAKEILQMKISRAPIRLSSKKRKELKKNYTPKKVLKATSIAKKVSKLPPFEASNINKIQINTEKCFYCRTKPAKSIDHIIAVSKGGHKSSEHNRVTACTQCNNIKGDLSLEAFRELLKVCAFSTRRQFANYGQTRWNNSIISIAALIKYRDSNLDLMLKDTIVNDSYQRLRLGVLKPTTYIP